MESRDIARLTSALRSVGAKLDARSEASSVSAVPDTAASSCPVPCAQVERCLEAVREAVRALEVLLSQVPR